MERGEVVAFAVSFGMLVALVFLLNLTAGSTGNGTAPSSLDTAFWGAPSLSQRIPYAGTLTTNSSQSLIYLGFTVNGGGTIAGASASRVCQNQPGSQGQVQNYGNLTFEAGATTGQYYLVIGPTTQASGWQCTYTASISVSPTISYQWTGTVVME